MNPLKNIRKPSVSVARDRRFEPGEYESIRAALAESSNPCAAPAFDLAIETRQWEWVDLERRLVRTPTSARGAENKAVPAVLPLSTRALAVLRKLQSLDEQQVPLKHSSGAVLRTTPNAVRCIWQRICPCWAYMTFASMICAMRPLHGLFEKGLHSFEVASITGHRSMQMLKRYTPLKPESLLARLG